jgi:hypothetical protein
MTALVEIIIPSSVKVLGEESFHACRSLSSVTLKSKSKLLRIEKEAFSQTGLVEIVLPASVKVSGEKCFSHCRSLSSVTFESGLRLGEVSKDAFLDVPILPIFPTKKCCSW